MTETMTRLFNTPALARQAAGELERVAVPQDAITIIAGEDRHGGGEVLDALMLAGVGREEAQALAEALRPGGSVICVRIAEDRIAAARAALDSVPIVSLQPSRASYQVGGDSQADGSAPPDEQAIVHDRAR